MATSTPTTTVVAPRHSLLEDALGILTGVFVASLGLFLLKTSGVVTGGTAGLALLISYGTKIPFEVLFVAVNLPFFALAAWKKGWNFTARSALSVVLVSVLTPLQAIALAGVHPDPLYAAVAGNLLVGIGLLILFRHQSSLGGFNIVALLAQAHLGIRAGFVQMGLDVAVILISLSVVSPITVLISALGAVILNIVLAVNHRPGRYLGM